MTDSNPFLALMKTAALLCVSGFCLTASAAGPMPSGNLPSIHVDDAAKVYRIDAADVTYVLGVNAEGQVQTIYWGKRLAASDKFRTPKAGRGQSSFDQSISVTPHEFAGWGGGNYLEPDLKITFPDGNRDLALKFVSSKQQATGLDLLMKDVSREVYVTLHYAIDAGTGIVRRSATIENRTGIPFTMEQVAAGTYNLPWGTDYHLHFLTGRWAGEWTVQDEAIRAGKITLESRRGSTSSTNNPWFAIDRDLSQDQEVGDVYFGALAWSGSWQITVEQDALQNVHVTGGMNAFDFGYYLKPGEHFDTPEFVGGFSSSGLGGASRLMHQLEIDTIVPHAPTPRLRPIVYNSWEATEFSLNEQNQTALIDSAAKIGIERFVMDDGWFGQRKNDHSGLGDWYVNKEKFPSGLKPVIDKVHAAGMEYGLWVEPEMVNKDSDLYRKHPDWVLSFPGRQQTEGRNQLMLNLARPDVRAYVSGWLNQLLDQNQIDFLKWDYNREWSEPGWSAVPMAQQKNVYVDFIRNFYAILEDLRARHPKIEIESCSGGGARVDLGVMRYTDQMWPSDNTDAFDRLTIQNGFTYAYSPGLLEAWVTDSPTWVNHRTVSLPYRFLSSMQASLGVGANLTKFTQQDMETAQRMITQYKSIRETVQRGLLYRLVLPENNSATSVTETVSRDGKRAAVFAFLHSSTELYPFPTVKLRGLEANTVYSLMAFEGKLSPGTPTQASGAYWMQHGFDLELRGDFQAAGLTLEATGAQ